MAYLLVLNILYSVGYTKQNGRTARMVSHLGTLGIFLKSSYANIREVEIGINMKLLRISLLQWTVAELHGFY